MNIILFGYRGSGKTTLGRMLADQLWKTFADVDEAARQRFGGRPIADIWAQHGEAAFRQTETEVAIQLCAQPDMVIALGGGTLMQEPARQAVQAAKDAVRIYLRCEPEELLRRLQADKATTTARPNLTNLGGGLDEIKAVLAQREPVYLQIADKVFDVTHLNPQDAAAHLIRRCL